jgi:hypothetical protein
MHSSIFTQLVLPALTTLTPAVDAGAALARAQASLPSVSDRARCLPSREGGSPRATSTACLVAWTGGHPPSKLQSCVRRQ